MRVKEILKEKGMTVQGLADKLGVSRQVLSRQIHGKLLVETAERIAAAIGVPTWQLFSSEEDAACSAKKDISKIACPYCGKTINLKADKDE